jgi:virginiamycin B lyase
MIFRVASLVAVSLACAQIGAQTPVEQPPNHSLPTEEWPIPASHGALVASPALDGQGGVWIAAERTDTLLRFDIAHRTFDRVPLPLRMRPRGLCSALGAVWISGTAAGAEPGIVLRVDLATHVVKTYRIPDSTVVDPGRLAADEKSQTVWFTASDAATVGRLDPRTGGVLLWHLARGSHPTDVVVDSAGHAWFVAPGAHTVGLVDMVARSSTSFRLRDSTSTPSRVFAPSDGAVWYADARRQVLAHFDTRDTTTKPFAFPQFAESAVSWTPGGDGSAITVAVSGTTGTRFVWLDLTTHAWSDADAAPTTPAKDVRGFAVDPSARAIWYLTDHGTLGRLPSGGIGDR